MSIKKRIINYQEAIAEGLFQSMKKDRDVFVIGLGVGDYKGIFGTTTKVNKVFGKERVIEVPASESALTGICAGAALKGKKPVIVHARNDFMFLTLDQMCNIASKWKYTCAGKSKVPFVVRGIIGKGWGQGPTHSQSIQSIFMHFPGMYVFMPSNVYDAKAAIITSLKQDCPCIILEHRRLYDAIGHVPNKMIEIEPGKAKIVKKGKDITLVATSIMVREAIKAAQCLKKLDIDIEIIDPRTLVPLDEKAIIRSVKKTGRLIIADTGWVKCGFTAEVSAIIAEKAFDHLKSPIKRIGMAECPAPVSYAYEQAYYPTYKDIVMQACRLLGVKVEAAMLCDKEVDSFVGPY